ncbi:MAG: hypothetical protein AAFO74_01970 [Pseudomonadota bacterium]
MSAKNIAIAILAGLISVACTGAPSRPAMANDADCAASETIGRFDPATDLFIAQFDIKTDTDDLHSAAAVATMLAHPRFACVDYLAVSGTYGMQGGSYVDPDTLFEKAFGDRWIEAHNNRDTATQTLAARIAPVIANGGHVWIMEAGQSDVSAATIAALPDGLRPPEIKARVHIVQHSDWNERVTSPEALERVKREVDYIKIADGNAVGNGTPGFNTDDRSAWPALLSAASVGAIWQQAQALALKYNGSGHDDQSIAVGGYDNQAIGAGGLDFSDTSEAAYIFGYDAIYDVDAFVAAFVQSGAQGSPRP